MRIGFATAEPLTSYGSEVGVHMKRIGELKRRAERYRQMRRQITDDRAAKALGELADETEMTASELEKRLLIRERAHEIWIEHGHPEGRDVEFWLAAEHELAECRKRRAIA
jgi:hypothetical protein